MGEPTYRPLTGEDLWLAGDALPGLLDGWCGPLETRIGATWRPAVMDPFGTRPVWQPTFDAPVHRLDCRRPEVRDHARRVLLAGEECKRCEGTGESDGYPLDESSMHPDPGNCDACNGSGYLRKPADLGPIIEAELRGDITPTEAAGLVWCSLLRVAAGVKPARAIVSEYMTPKWADLVMFARHIPRDSLCTAGGRLVCIVEHDGWYLQPPHDPYSRRNVPHGPETGDAGKSAADTAALAAGYALREPGALLLPLPDGVIGRLEVSDAG